MTVKHTIRRITREYKVLYTGRDRRGNLSHYVLAPIKGGEHPFVVSAAKIHKENPELNKEAS